MTKPRELRATDIFRSLHEKMDQTSEHPILRELREVRRASFGSRLLKGLMLPFRAVKFLAANPQLWKFVLAPAIINILLFVGALFLLLPRTGLLAEWLQIEAPLGFGGPWLETAVEYLLTVVLGLLSIVAAYVLVLLFGGVVASPFNDILSERTERVLLDRDEVVSRDESALWGMFRGVGVSIFMLGAYLFFMTWIVLLNLIPGLGPPLATVLGTGLSALFLAVEFCGPAIDRRGGGLRRKFEAIERHRTLAVGFGLGSSLLLWIPIMNFLTIPVAVSAGTALGIVLGDWEQRAARRGAPNGQS